MSLCQIEPISAFMSTNLNSQMECYQRLGQRILRTLGYPMINVEVHPDQLYEAISMSMDFFTMYGGYTKEYIIFDSRLYEHDRGIRLDNLFTVANSGYTTTQILQDYKIGPDPDFTVTTPESLYISLSAIPASYFTSSSSLSSAVLSSGIARMQLVNKTTYAELTSFSEDLVTLFTTTAQETLNIQCVPQEGATSFNNMFDYDIMDYRKVIDVVTFEEGTSAGVNSLFSLENTLAQQTYYSYAMGNFGFDMLSWNAVKSWMDTREKMFATKKDIYFDQRTQYMKIYPQPKPNVQYYGILECWVERPIRDLVKEKWVLEYATAMTKIMWGRVLTKINGVNLIGGGSINGDLVLSEGLSEKDRLEELLVDGAYGSEPAMFGVY